MDPHLLREKTRAEHEATEALMPLTGEGLTEAVYVRTLETLYPLIASWEHWAAANAPEAFRGMLPGRLRSHLLAADLRTLQGVQHVLPEGRVDWNLVVGETDREDPKGEAAFLGAMYVMEGSTLGGRYLAKQVESALGLTPGQGDAYFRGHGEATGPLWREFTAQIAAVPDGLAPVVVETARRTFRAFGQALEQGNTQNLLHG